MIDWGANVEVELTDWATDGEIERVVRLYIDGAREGNATKLREAFHEDAWMFGSVGAQRLDMPIADMIEMSDGVPADVDGSYKARIVAIDQVGDAATATVEEDGFWGSVSFTDFFTLARIDGDWKIVNKAFAHTRGTPPPMWARRVALTDGDHEVAPPRPAPR
jgi:Putative lumazine-binding